jgi:hypothetical protein
VFAELIRDSSTGGGLRQRAKALSRRLRDEGNGRRPGPAAVARVLRAREPQDFTDMHRKHFAIDRFPENEARFRLNYSDVRADAEVRAKRKGKP